MKQYSLSITVTFQIPFNVNLIIIIFAQYEINIDIALQIVPPISSIFLFKKMYQIIRIIIFGLFNPRMTVIKLENLVHILELKKNTLNWQHYCKFLPVQIQQIQQ